MLNFVKWNVLITDKKSDLTSEYKYEMIPVNENNVMIFNKETGEYWRKYIPSGEGPTNWDIEESPIFKK